MVDLRETTPIVPVRISARWPSTEFSRAVLLTLASLGIGLCTWQFLSSVLFNPFLIPPPLEVIRTAGPMLASGEIATDVTISMVRALGELLVREALASFNKTVVSYGKAAIVGVAGDIEHGAAIIHPRVGKPIRDAIGGGQALIPSNVKIGAAGASIDVPLGHKDDAWSFDEIDTIGVTISGAPRPDEIVIIAALADGGRPRPRVSKAGAVPPRWD